MAPILDQTPILHSSSDATTCRHCGERCSPASIRTSAGSFCCTGCEAVFALLHREGLDTFYACEVPPGAPQRHAPASEAALAALDDPAVGRRFTEYDDGRIARVVFSVPGLHCASCLWLIERLWRVQPGIVRADADIVRRTVRITFRRDRLSVRDVASCLASVGYTPALDNESRPTGIPPARRSLYLKIGVAGFAFGNAMLFSIPRYANGAPLEDGFQTLFGVLNLVLAVPVLIYSASDFFRSAWQALRHRTMSLDVPIAIGLAALFVRTVVEIASGRGEGFTDSFTGLVFFLLVGRLFQQQAFDRIAFDRSFRSFLPLAVLVEASDSDAVVPVPLEHVTVGDRLLVRPGEIVPADATLTSPSGALDLSFITGESTPVHVLRGDSVQAGARVVGTALRLTAASAVSQSRLAGLWNNPVFGEAKTYRLVDVAARFGAAFTVTAVVLAAAGAALWWPDISQSASVATAVLIIACPCALTLAAPITLGTAMAMLGRHGLYLKQAAVVLDLARVDTIVFDKTGTLSTPMPADEPALDRASWRLVRRLAAESVHPASRAIVAGAEIDRDVPIESCLDVPGRGVFGRVDGHDLAIGSRAFVSELALGLPALVGLPESDEAQGPAVAIDGQFAGWARMSSTVRPGLRAVLRLLRRRYDLLLVSGDHPAEAARWRRVFRDAMWFRQSPEEKLAIVRARQRDGHHVLMLGDGLNDAGALGAADVGLAVSDETACIVPACDAVVAGDRLRDLPRFLAYARRARQVIVFCFAVSVFYNVVGVGLALAGLLTPLATAILMPLSSLTIVGLSIGGMRAFARAELAS